MTPDFSVVQQEFTQQLSILDTLVETVDICAGNDGSAPILIRGRSVPQLHAESESSMAASAIVILAAYFEAFITAQLEEYARGVLSNYQAIHEDSQSKLISAYWKSGLTSLGRIKPKEDTSWSSKASTLLSMMERFPVQGDGSHASAAILCDHENNMRWDVITEVSSRLGVKKLAAGLFQNTDLKRHLGSANSNEFTSDLRARLMEFQDLRNRLMHAISQASGIGFSVYSPHRQFLGLFSVAFSELLTKRYPEFQAAAARGKVKLTASA